MHTDFNECACEKGSGLPCTIDILRRLEYCASLALSRVANPGGYLPDPDPAFKKNKNRQVNSS